MLKNYMRIAWRTMRKHKGYTLINVGGLAVGMTIGILILLYVRYERQYDHHHEKADQIYRVTLHTRNAGSALITAKVPVPAASTFLAEMPDVAHATRILAHSTYLGIPVLQFQAQSFLEHRLFYADASVCEVFSFDWLQGDPQTALAAPNSVVLTASTAQKYFGAAPPVGQVLTLKSRIGGQPVTHEITVTGVVQDQPAQTHFHFDLLVSSDLHPYIKRMQDNWNANEAWTYLVLPDPAAPRRVTEQFTGFVQRHFPDNLVAETTLHLQPLTDIHLHSQLYREIQANSNVLYLYILSAIALLILLIACINFMNLATARSASRAKEVGMRKVLGAYRRHLVAQFLGEALLFSFLAVLITIGLLEFGLPFFKDLVGKPLTLNYTQDGYLIGLLLTGGFGVGLLAGSYPAFFLSSFTPAQTLKGGHNVGTKAQSLRRILVVSQFAISILLMICIGVIGDQMDYIQDKDLGYPDEQILFVRTQGPLYQQPERRTAFKQALLQHENVLHVTGTWSLPGSRQAPVFNYFFEPEGRSPDDRMRMALIRADHDFVEAFDLQMIQGRALSASFSTDEAESFILSESAVRALGWTDDPLGKRLTVFSGSNNPFKQGPVVGVIKDIHHQSLHHELTPLVLSGAATGQYRYLALRVDPARLSQTLAFVETTWDTFSPDVPIEVFFLDEDLNAAYQHTQLLSASIRLFALIAVFIACLGLFGLAAYMAERRTKEMGIRKVFGASSSGLVALLASDFLWLVFVAFLIAAPIAFALMQYWLDRFAYRTELQVGDFVLAGLLAELIALLTVSYQAIKAAQANPIEAIRYE